MSPSPDVETVKTSAVVDRALADPNDLILVTGAAGFIGRKVVENLIRRGFVRIRCFARKSSDPRCLASLLEGYPLSEVVSGNLLSPDDCLRAAEGAVVVYHLAAGRGEKSFSDAYMNSVVTTRNLLEAAVRQKTLRRFVNISSFTVYTKRGKLLDEAAPVETKPSLRGEAYCFAKSRQEDIVEEYGRKHGLPYVTLRPGYVYGPGNEAISSRVGIDTFGVFLHLGGRNPVPLSYVDNCAEAIALAGLTPSIDGEIINVVDDDLPSSREFLRAYKQKVRKFWSLPVPKPVSYLLCAFWENYSKWSEGQLPPAYNRRLWQAYWKDGTFTNAKLKRLLKWSPLVPTKEALERYFESCRAKMRHA